jgi:hypothetical protein
VLALIDAKHNGFYACGYNDYKIDFEPCYIMREKVIELIKDYDQVVCSTLVDGIETKTVSVCEGLINAIELNLDKVTFDIEALSPLYVRKSQAEEGR